VISVRCMLSVHIFCRDLTPVPVPYVCLFMLSDCAMPQQTAFCEQLFEEWSGSLDGHTAELKQKLMNDVKGLTTAKVLLRTTARVYKYISAKSSEKFS
jgi:hypothetical protein